jgi:hypothetical protein
VLRKCLAIAALFLVTAAVPLAGGGTTGTLSLRGTLDLVSTQVQCPPQAPPAAECRARTGAALVRGLGSVSETYTWFFRMGPPTCPLDVGKPLATTGRLVVVRKGEIHFALADGARCVAQEPIENEPQDFTITGGTGTYEGASGSGTLARSVGFTRGTERWAGTLVVPGLEFDLTPPRLSGATSKTVRARNRGKRVRVIYKVTATDAVDGQVASTCVPRSGSRFRIGRTFVRCSAIDTSANTATARFTVTVRRAR